MSINKHGILTEICAHQRPLPIRQRARRRRTPAVGRLGPLVQRVRHQVHLAGARRLEDLHPHVDLQYVTSRILFPLFRVSFLLAWEQSLPRHDNNEPILLLNKQLLTPAATVAGFCPVYSFSLFLPTIIKNMGYSANNAQLMSVPPYVFACAFTIGGSYLADRRGQRGVFLLGFQLVAILGVTLLAASENTTIQYTGTVLAAVGESS